MDPIKCDLLAPAHHGQHSILRSSLSTGHRCIDEVQMVGGCGRGELACDGCRCSGVVHEDRVGGHASESTIGTQGHTAQVVVIADAGENNRSALRGFAGGLGDLTVMLVRPDLRSGSCPVIDGDMMPCGSQVASHRPAHGAQAQEGNVLCRDRFVGSAHVSLKIRRVQSSP